MERAFIGKHPASGREVRKPLVRVGVRLQGSGPSVRVCSEAGGRAEARPALKLETHPGQISSGARGPGRFTFEVNTARGVQEVGHPGVHGGSGLGQQVSRPPGVGSSSRTCSPAPCGCEPLTLPLRCGMGSRPLQRSAASPCQGLQPPPGLGQRGAAALTSWQPRSPRQLTGSRNQVSPPRTHPGFRLSFGIEHSTLESQHLLSLRSVPGPLS